MVNVQPTNAKLVDRAHRIIMAATGVDEGAAIRLLSEGGSVKKAIAMQKLTLTPEAAEAALSAANGSLAVLLRRG
jgi:N-acetylmuramic acid 6-phosphate etherase